MVLAYIDPGSGSMIAQLAVAGAAGVAVAVKVAWRKTAGRIRGRDGHAADEVADDC
jgi:hypothetical protein